MGEAVADEAKLALLDILLDGVEKLLLGDLSQKKKVSIQVGCISGLRHFIAGLNMVGGQNATHDPASSATQRNTNVPRACHWSSEESQQSC